uniref:ATP synthase subunit a n=1 Tax=Rhizophydium sp. 136 TaxID=60187 RepID=Q950M4_9FUNG|nr:ATP synthase F0 subunit 6 [Rhizophydium sp. 136]AAK84284.1 ATP synthase F0 subunit 6 [Rhizophydium sp. 136]
MNNFMMYSPMEQYIINPVIDINLTINNVILYLMFGAFITILIGKGIFNGNSQTKIISNNWGIMSESLMRTILLMIENYVGLKYSIYLPLFYSIFHLVLFSNILGLVPYSTTPTVELVMTLSISFTLLMGILLIGFLTHKLRLLAIFLPSGTPLGLILPMIGLEVLAFVLRILSLGLRLSINMITGHLLLKVILGFIWSGYLADVSFFILAIPIILLTIFICLEVLIAYLQSYILIFLVILTLKDCTMS